jgi:shikimate kinase
MHTRAKITSWACLVASILLLAVASDNRKQRPWILGSSCAVLAVGSTQRRTVKQLQERLEDIEQESNLSFLTWIRSNMQPSSTLAITVPALTAGWQPENLITDPVEYIQKKQKHVALIGGTGDGKSTFTQFLSSKIGGRVVIYDSDAKPEDWAWLDQNDVVGRKGNFKAIDTAMGKDLDNLEDLVQLRGESGDKVLAGRERFLIAEEFPVLVDECDNAVNWLKKHAKRGRRYKQFVLAIAQNDTAENFGLQGDKDTLYSCFCLVRLGQFAALHARTKLKDSRLEQWLKAGGKKRFMVDDFPVELDLSNWGATTQTPLLLPVDSTVNNVDNQPTPSNEYEQYIVDWGKRHPQEVLKARTLQQSSRLFQGMPPEDIRIIFVALADRKLGEIVGKEERIGWKWSKTD